MDLPIRPLLDALAAILPPAAHARAQDRPRPDSAVVVLLGTGIPRPDPDASGPATAVVIGPRVLLFDAGPGHDPSGDQVRPMTSMLRPSGALR